jgi:hypothetical protein
MTNLGEFRGAIENLGREEKQELGVLLDAHARSTPGTTRISSIARSAARRLCVGCMEALRMKLLSLAIRLPGFPRFRERALHFNSAVGAVVARDVTGPRLGHGRRMYSVGV